MVPITINELWGDDLQNSDQDLTMTIDRFGERYIEGSAAAIANMIDGDLADLYDGFGSFVGTPGVIPTTVAPYAAAGVALQNNAVPQNVSQLAMVISPEMQANALGFNANLFNPQKEVAQQYLTGKMGQALNFRWNSDPNVARHTVGALGTAGAITSAPLMNGATANGATQIVTDGWDAGIANILLKGDKIQIAGCYGVNPISYRNYGKLMTFTVTANVSSVGADATIPVSPAINADTTSQFQTVTALPADGAEILVWGVAAASFSTIAGVSFAAGMAFHKDALTLAVVKQELPGGMEWSEFASNPKMGMWVRLVRGYLIGSNEKVTRVDVLGGVKRVRDEMGCIVCG
jgi:hypothetical protein